MWGRDKMKNIFIVLGLFLILSSIFLSQSLACSFDTDCEVGSKCVKAPGSIYGVCKGGLFPGNENDDEPVYAPLDLDGTYGNTCQFDTDCGISNVCVKSGGSIYGVCMKKTRDNIYTTTQDDEEKKNEENEDEDDE